MPKITWIPEENVAVTDTGMVIQVGHFNFKITGMEKFQREALTKDKLNFIANSMRKDITLLFATKVDNLYREWIEKDGKVIYIEKEDKKT